MDGRGRLAEPLKRPVPRPERRARASAASELCLPARDLPRTPAKNASRISSFMRFCRRRLEGVAIPRCTGITALALFLAASMSYGAVRGGHLPMSLETLTDWRDAAANSMGLRITGIPLAGEKHGG